MKTKTVFTWLALCVATTAILFLGVTIYKTRHEKSGLQKLVDTTRPDISSEDGRYGYYRIYTGMLLCKDCDSIAARVILKSEQESSTDGVATFETTRIITGAKPEKLPIQKALWTTIVGNTSEPNARYISLFNDDDSIAAFLIDESLNSAKWKILVEATPEGDPLSKSENRIGKLVLMSEGKTNL